MLGGENRHRVVNPFYPYEQVSFYLKRFVIQTSFLSLTSSRPQNSSQNFYSYPPGPTCTVCLPCAYLVGEIAIVRGERGRWILGSSVLLAFGALGARRFNEPHLMFTFWFGNSPMFTFFLLLNYSPIFEVRTWS